MAKIETPVCDRCGFKGREKQQFAQLKIISSTGRISVMDLCGPCEFMLGNWMDEPKQERGNADGTD